MVDKNSCVVIYPTHEQAEQAIKDLGKAGLTPKNCRSSAMAIIRNKT